MAWRNLTATKSAIDCRVITSPIHYVICRVIFVVIFAGRRNCTSWVSDVISARMTAKTIILTKTRNNCRIDMCSTKAVYYQWISEQKVATGKHKTEK